MTNYDRIRGWAETVAPYPQAFTAVEAARALGLSTATAFEAMASAVKYGLVEKFKMGRSSFWRFTVEGRDEPPQLREFKVSQRRVAPPSGRRAKGMENERTVREWVATVPKGVRFTINEAAAATGVSYFAVRRVMCLLRGDLTVRSYSGNPMKWERVR